RKSGVKIATYGGDKVSDCSSLRFEKMNSLERSDNIIFKIFVHFILALSSIVALRDHSAHPLFEKIMPKMGISPLCREERAEMGS
ncbi:MAG: hypothetical protein Q7S53_00165, partial [bacterium]|nr:hypothetical protein [bacterium]